MDLGKQVDRLEQELQVLKNQIQATLLDIQEVVLTNAHYALRADASALPAATAEDPDCRATAQQQVAALNTPIPSLPQDETPTDPREETIPNARIRQISLDELAAQSVANNVPDDPAMPQPASWPVTDDPYPSPAPLPASPGTSNGTGPYLHQQAPSKVEPNWAELTALEEWAVYKLEQIGADQTRALIDYYTEKGRFAEEIRDALLEYLALYEDTQLPAEIWDHAYQQHQPSILAAPPQTPSQTPPARSDNHKGSRRSMRQREDEQPPQIEMAEDNQVERCEELESRNMVLRLIAGVHNAALGWKKNDG